jgi:hypothetical protein
MKRRSGQKKNCMSPYPIKLPAQFAELEFFLTFPSWTKLSDEAFILRARDAGGSTFYALEDALLRVGLDKVRDWLAQNNPTDPAHKALNRLIKGYEVAQFRLDRGLVSHMSPDAVPDELKPLIPYAERYGNDQEDYPIYVIEHGPIEVLQEVIAAFNAIQPNVQWVQLLAEMENAGHVEETRAFYDLSMFVEQAQAKLDWRREWLGKP